MLPQPWTAAMKATIFVAWTYDHLLPHGAAGKVAQALSRSHARKIYFHPTANLAFY
jgi:hypothetical protein